MLQSMRTSLELEIVGSGTTDPYLLEDDVSILVVQMTFPNSDATARIETTIDTNERVEAGTAVWTPWDYGDVSDTTIATAFAPNAIRVVNLGPGTVRVGFRGNLR